MNTVLAHLNTPKNGFDLAMRDFVPLLQDAWLPIGLTVAAVLLPAFVDGAALPILYVGTSAGLALYSLRNTGSDVNYLIEPAAAACIPAALAIDWLWRTDGNPRLLAASARCSLAVATVVWAAGLWDFWRLDGGVDPTSRLPVAEIAAAETVLSEEPLAVLLAGKPLVVSDTFHLSMLTTSEFFDPLELERRIKRSEFDLIVMRSDIRAARWWKRQLLLPETVRLAIKDTYVRRPGRDVLAVQAGGATPGRPVAAGLETARTALSALYRYHGSIRPAATRHSGRRVLRSPSNVARSKTARRRLSGDRVRSGCRQAADGEGCHGGLRWLWRGYGGWADESCQRHDQGLG